MIDEKELIDFIQEQQADDDKPFKFLYFNDRCMAIYKAKKSVRDKIIETIENMSKGTRNDG